LNQCARLAYRRQIKSGCDPGRLGDSEVIAFPLVRREHKASASLVLRAEGSYLPFVSGQYHARYIGRLFEGRTCFDINPAGQSCHQIAALGKQREIHSLQKNRDSLGCGLGDAAIRDRKDERAVTTCDLVGQGETGRGIAIAVDRGLGTVDLLAIDARRHGYACPGGYTAFGAGGL